MMARKMSPRDLSRSTCCSYVSGGFIEIENDPAWFAPLPWVACGVLLPFI